ncbi:MAG TPA: DUF5050 domain-containing protein [Clostridiales bacterium]|nr:DUF5050 domain-containing protein [Clostridiales bacterium]
MKKSVKLLLLIFIIISFAGCSNQSAEKLNRYGNVANRSFVASDGEYIYYYSHLERSLCKANFDGSNETVIWVDENYSSKYEIEILVEDGWIYFNPNEGICRIRTDGQEKTVLVHSDYTQNYLNIEDGWIYYQLDIPIYTGGCIIEPSFEIWKVKWDGSENQKIIEDGGKCLTVINT